MAVVSRLISGRSEHIFVALDLVGPRCPHTLRCEYVTGNGRCVGQRLRSYAHAWIQVRAASGHVGSCIARRPAFSHGCSPPASAVSRREPPLTIASASPVTMASEMAAA
eukprot:1692514-Prymnesium_polylepis.1